MKRIVKVLFMSIIALLPLGSVLATNSGDWGFGIQLSQGSNYAYTANFSDDTISYSGYGKYIRNTHTFAFEKDASIYALGIDADNNINLVIEVNGDNKISKLIYEDELNDIKTGSYTVKGSGTLIIDGAAIKDPYAYDEENNKLCSVGIKYNENGESKSVYLDYKNGVNVTCDNVEDSLKKMWANILKLDQYSNLPASYDDISIEYKINAHNSGYESVYNLSQWASSYIKTSGKMEVSNGKIVINLNTTEEETKEEKQEETKEEEKKETKTETTKKSEEKTETKKDDKKEESKKDDDSKKKEDSKKDEVEESKILENKKMGVTFESEEDLSSDYSLEVIDVTDDYKDKNITIDSKELISVLEIDVKNKNEVVSMEDGNFVIKIKLTDEMKKYNSFMVAYINDDKVEESFKAVVDDDTLEFKTTHLSKYAIYGESIQLDKQEVLEENKPNDSDKENDNDDNGTGKIVYVIIGIVALVGIVVTIFFMRKNKLSN